MTERDEQASDDVQPHFFQRVLDNPWLLLALGLLVMFVSYTAWGWLELASLPDAKLP